jgi:hypothetical protein
LILDSRTIFVKHLMKHSRTAVPQPHNVKLIMAVLILTPLLLALAWGVHFTSEVYTLLRFARGLTAGTGMTLDAVGEFPAPTLNGALFAFVLSIPTWLGIEPAWGALIFSAAGWSVAALAFLAIGQSLGRLGGAVVAALLLSFNPAIIAALGSPASWILALGWLSIALLLRRHLVIATFTLLLLVMLLIPWPTNSGWSHLSLYGGAVAWSILLFTTGMGADWLAEKLVKRDLVRLTYSQTKTSLLVALFIVLGSWQGVALWQLFQERPENLWQLEEEVASWLRSETDETATLLADEKIGYLANRPAATMPDLHQLETATAVQAKLKAQPVDYLVTTNELPWQQLREQVWFRLAYELAEQFNSSYLHQAPYTIWAYRRPLSELGERHSINARVPDRLSILGYQIGPQQVQPGDSVQMALYMQAPEAANAPSIPFEAIIRLISPIDGSTVSEWIVNLPQSISPTEWQANDVLIEQFPLTMPDELEAGAYQFNLSLIGSDSSEMWPFSLDKDINRLDRIPIGGLMVPWEGSLDNVQELRAVFANQIELAGFSTTAAKY